MFPKCGDGGLVVRLRNRDRWVQGSQGSKIALVRSFLRVPQAEGQVKILIFQVKIKFFPIYANSFCDAGQVLIFRYFEPCGSNPARTVGFF